MRKIMFNDRFLLTQAVLEGRKTQTRRLEKCLKFYSPADPIWVNSRYKTGELVAIAQSYKDTYDYMTEHLNELGIIRRFARKLIWDNYRDHKGWGNKMFVKPDFMQHHIKIKNVRLQRLQDITDDEVLLEGVREVETSNNRGNSATHTEYSVTYYDKKGPTKQLIGRSPKEAYAALINVLSGKGTWESNPYVFVYDFELSDLSVDPHEEIG